MDEPQNVNSRDFKPHFSNACKVCYDHFVGRNAEFVNIQPRDLGRIAAGLT